MMKTALIHATIYDFEQFLTNSYVIFDETILEIGPMAKFVNHNYRVINCKDHIVMPSLVVGHTHVYSAFARGMQVSFQPNTFLDILEQMWWKMDRQIDNETTYYSGIVAAVEFMKHGVTTIIDHHASGIDITGSLEQLHRAIVEEAGLRGCFAFEVSDRFDVDTAIKENVDFFEKHRSETSRGMFGLHASMSLSDATLRKVKKHLGNNRIHIHVAESNEDQIDCMQKYNMRVINRLDTFGLLKPSSILVHGIHLDENELDVIKTRGCHIALNVTSNMNNGVGLPNYHAMKEKNIPLILGNDGLSFSMTQEYHNIYYTNHAQDQSPIHFGFDDLKAMIDTTYQMVSDIFDVKLGRIAVNYQADLLIIPYVSPTPINENNAFGHLFFGLFSQFLPRHCFVRGYHVLNNYEASPSLMESYRKAVDVAEELWNRIKEAEEKGC